VDYVSQIPESLKTILEFPGYTADNMSKYAQSVSGDGTRPELCAGQSSCGITALGPLLVSPSGA
jgi:hypothetical protein